MSSRIAIVNYGMGNLNSVKKMLDRLNADSIISADIKEIATSDKIILPGVGHFAKAMANLKELNLIDALNEAVLNRQKPILGICLGMQLLANRSAEGNAEGLKWIDGDVVKFDVSDKFKYKIPHMGWNQIQIRKQSSLMKEIPDMSEFYFVHSYHLKVRSETDSLNTTEFDYEFTSAVEKENVFGVQYHPEKSHDAGRQLLKNFIEL